MFFFHFLKNCADIHFYFIFLISVAQQTYPLPKGGDVQMGVWEEKREKSLNKKNYSQSPKYTMGEPRLGLQDDFPQSKVCFTKCTCRALQKFGFGKNPSFTLWSSTEKLNSAHTGRSWISFCDHHSIRLDRWQQTVWDMTHVHPPANEMGLAL